MDHKEQPEYILRHGSTKLDVSKIVEKLTFGYDTIWVVLHIKRGWGDHAVKFLTVHTDMKPKDILWKIAVKELIYELPNDERVRLRKCAFKKDEKYAMCLADDHAYVYFAEKRDGEIYDPNFMDLLHFIYRDCPSKRP